jgi:large subunit ribosomal protein L20
MRVKRGTTTHAKHKKLRAQTKGYGHMRRASVRMARQAILKALSYAYRDRRNKKRDLRQTWITRINAALTEHGISYSKFIAALKRSNIELDRKILAELAVKQPTVFKAVVDQAKSAK